MVFIALLSVTVAPPRAENSLIMDASEKQPEQEKIKEFVFSYSSEMEKKAFAAVF